MEERNNGRKVFFCSGSTEQEDLASSTTKPSVSRGAGNLLQRIFYFADTPQRTQGEACGQGYDKNQRISLTQKI